MIKFGRSFPKVTLLEVARQISIPLVEMLVAYGISFRQQIERQRLYEETRFAKQIIENTMEGIWMADSSGRIRIVNSAFSQITGYEYDEAVGKELFFFFGTEPGTDSGIRTIISELEQKSGHCKKEIIGKRKNGEFYPALLSISYKLGYAYFLKLISRKPSRFLCQKIYEHLLKYANISALSKIN